MLKKKIYFLAEKLPKLSQSFRQFLVIELLDLGHSAYLRRPESLDTGSRISKESPIYHVPMVKQALALNRWKHTEI